MHWTCKGAGAVLRYGSGSSHIKIMRFFAAPPSAITGKKVPPAMIQYSNVYVLNKNKEAF
jgi:hypothetical protein